MEMILAWWKSRPQRDRRALILLSVVVPVILGWWLVTLPGLEKLATERRIHEALLTQSREMKNHLTRASALQLQLSSLARKSSSDIMAYSEKILQGMGEDSSGFALHRSELSASGIRQPGAELRFTSVSIMVFGRLFSRLASSGLNIGRLEIAPSSAGDAVSGRIQVWRSAE